MNNRGLFMGIVAFFSAIFGGIAFADMTYSNKCDNNVCKIKFSGSSDKVVNLDSEAIALSIKYSGSGGLEVNGSVKKITVYHTGSGELDLQNLSVDEATVYYSGSGALHINSVGTISGDNSGSANIYLHGPGEVKMKNSGSGKVIKIN